MGLGGRFEEGFAGVIFDIFFGGRLSGRLSGRWV